MIHDIPVEGADEADTCGVVSSGGCSPDAMRSDPAVQFAANISTLAAVAEGRDYLPDFGWLLKGNARVRRPPTPTWCTWDIPGLPEDLQPIPKVRAAYWFAVTLADEYGWILLEVGRDTAGGGFIADILGEAMVIYPASMSDDHTVASALARLLGSMSAKEVAIAAALVEWHNGAGCPEGRSV